LPARPKDADGTFSDIPAFALYVAACDDGANRAAPAIHHRLATAMPPAAGLRLGFAARAGRYIGRPLASC